MVVSSKPDRPTPAWLACKMAAYTVLFLAFILGLVPYGFHHLGRLVYPQDVHDWLAAGSTQTIIGTVVCGVGLIGYLVCSLWLVVVGKGPFVEFDPPTEFVATGPYRWMRNPIASFLIFTVLGEAVLFGSAGVLTLFVLGFPLAQFQVSRIEEPRLRARFGDAYAEYCRCVPRWIPSRPRGA